MREIKFKGKRTDNGEWAYGYFYQTQKGEAQILQTNHPVGTWFVDAETVGQFTGLKDKNGNEIYEGDEVGFNVPPDQTVINATDWRRDMKGVVKYGMFGIDFGSFKSEFCIDIEVIGNIHDTKELTTK